MMPENRVETRSKILNQIIANDLWKIFFLF